MAQSVATYQLNACGKKSIILEWPGINDDLFPLNKNKNYGKSPFMGLIVS